MRSVRCAGSRRLLQFLCIALVTAGLLVIPFRAGPQQGPAIRLDVNLVQLPVTVTDSQGRNVGRLTQQAFQLYVDGVATPITAFYGDDAAITAGIVIDNSASMAPKTSEVIASAVAFANGSNPIDQMFVVHFSDHPRLSLPAGVPFTGNVPMLKAAISQFILGGTTALYDALIFAEAQFRSAYYARKVILVITDGTDNSSKAKVEDVLERADRTGAVIFAIGLFDQADRSEGERVLTQLAAKTGGAAVFPPAITDATAASVGIAQEIRQQYTLAFQGAEDGRFHRVTVIATDSRYGALKVHTRPGYFATRP